MLCDTKIQFLTCTQILLLFSIVKLECYLIHVVHFSHSSQICKLFGPVSLSLPSLMVPVQTLNKYVTLQNLYQCILHENNVFTNYAN